MTQSNRRAFTVIELLVVIGLLAVLVAVLLPLLSRARKSAAMSDMAAESAGGQAASQINRNGNATAEPQSQPAARPTMAAVSRFDANIVLTPRLSVGTAEPESIYEAKFSAKLQASSPPSSGAADCQILLPLPPQIISLTDLAVTVDGQPSDAITLEGDKLAWQGALKPDVPNLLEVTYTAVGKGLYTLQTPPGRVLDRFQIQLTANGSDVRMLELSMQPTSMTRASGQTIYTWDYHKLMFGRPIALDVLGIAPIDRLGELSWLGPISVVAFGVVVGFMAKAFGFERFDRWMLLLVLGTFTAAYPLMYFAQEFIPLTAAVLASAGVVMAIIGWRIVSIMGVRLGLGGVLLPAAAIMALTLVAAVHPGLQGVLLTILTLGLFILAMMLAPRLKLTPLIAPAVT